MRRQLSALAWLAFASAVVRVPSLVTWVEAHALRDLRRATKEAQAAAEQARTAAGHLGELRQDLLDSAATHALQTARAAQLYGAQVDALNEWVELANEALVRRGVEVPRG